MPCSPIAASEPQVSLVISTIGRPEDLRRLMASIAFEAADGPSLEVIVIDQGTDRRTLDLLAEIRPPFPLRYTTSPLGVSLGRNVGLALARGRYVMFPDDDATLAGDTVTKAVAHLESHPEHDGFSVQLRVETGRASQLRWADSARPVTLRNHHRTSIGSTIVVRAEAARAVGGFDEAMGPGAPGWYGSCEDADFVLRMVTAGAAIWYDPETTVYHRDNRADSGQTAELKALSYGCGQGYLWRKHSFPWLLVMSLLLRRIAGGTLLLIRGRRAIARTHLAWMRGAVNGLIGTEPIDLAYRAAGAHDQTHLRELAATRRPAHREFWRSFTWRLLASPMAAAATFALTAIAVRRFDDRAMNLLYATLAALMVGPVLVRFGLHQAAVREVADAWERLGSQPALELARRRVLASVGRSLLTAPAVAVLFIGGVDGGPGHNTQVALVAAILAIESVRLTISDVLGGLQRPGWAVALGHQGRAVVVIVVVIAQAWLIDGPLSVTGLLAMIGLVCLSLLLVGVARLWWSAGPPPPAQTIRLVSQVHGWRIGLPFLAVDLVAVLVARGDVLLAARVFEPQQAALYSTASVLAAQAATPIGLASVALAPVLARQLALGRLEEVERLLRTVAAVVGAAMALTMVAAALFGERILALAYGERFAAAESHLVTLMAGNLALALLGTGGVTLTMAGRQGVAMVVSVAWFAFAAPMNVLAAFWGGPVALAFASAATTVGLYLLLAGAVWVTTGIAILPIWRRGGEPMRAAVTRLRLFSGARR